MNGCLQSVVCTRLVAKVAFSSKSSVYPAYTSRLAWIKRQQQEFADQPRQGQRQMVTGETHYVFGQRYRLEVIERQGKHEVPQRNATKLQLLVNPGTSLANRQKVLNDWYRQQLKSRVPQLLQRWQPKIGVQVADWGVKKMKTKWGSCNIADRHIWLNLDLAGKPPECLEYILVHEMVHLLERNHNDRFRTYMNEFMPNWRLHRETLNRAPLAKET